MRSLFRLIGTVLFFVSTPAFAADLQVAWIVAEKSGDVRVVHPGLQPASVQVRSALVAGDIVTTGPTGRAMLTRGKDYVVVAPGSRLLLPQEEQQSGFTRLVQQVGTMLYKVHHTGVPHFAVQTPMLAAVVKGTSFTVIVEKDRAAVQVTDGVVEVSSVAGEAHRLVERGVTVYVGRERPDAIMEMKPGGPAIQDEPRATGVKISRSGDVPLSTIASLTGGLVNAAPASAVAAPSTNSDETASQNPSSVQPANGQPLQAALTDLDPTSIVIPAAVTLADYDIAGMPAPSLGLPGTADLGAVLGLDQPVADIIRTDVPAITQPVLDIVQTVVPAVTQPVVNVVQTAAPAVTQPVVSIVQTVVPAVTQPVVNVVQTAVPAVTQPVVSIVPAVVPAVTQPVVNVVQTVVPAVTQPVVSIVQTAVPAVTQPVVDIVQTIVPVVTQPVVDIVQTTVPAVTQPVVNVVQTTVPAILQPVINTVTQPVVSILGGLGSLLGH